MDVLKVMDEVIEGMGGPTDLGLTEARAAVAELIEAAKDFSNLYGHLWDTNDGGGWLSAESCEKYDKAHGKLHEALAKASP